MTSKVGSQQSTVNSYKSSVTSQQSTVNSQQSTAYCPLPTDIDLSPSIPYFLSLLLIIFFSFGCATYKGKLKEPVTQKKEYISQAAAKEGLPQDYRAYYHYLMGLINELHNDIRCL